MTTVVITLLQQTCCHCCHAVILYQRDLSQAMVSSGPFSVGIFFTYEERHPELSGAFLRQQWDEDYVLQNLSDQLVPLFHADLLSHQLIMLHH